MALPASTTATAKGGSFPDAKSVCFASQANELFFGIVGHVGSGTGFVATKLKELVAERHYQVEIIKASSAIRFWAEKHGRRSELPEHGGRSEIWKTEQMQSLGDDMRKTTDDYAAVAQGMIALIRDQRANWNGVGVVEGEDVPPNPDKPRAYVIESIRHPAEVSLLRLVYGDAFALIGVVCHEDAREERLIDKYFEWKHRSSQESRDKIRQLMDRDSDDKSNKFGQHVADAFWESDYFVDNTPSEEAPQEFTLNEDLGRLVDIITHSRIVRPTVAETGMHIAVSSQIRSSCLSRQVGAAIVDDEGNVLAIGSNEVPRAGGGVYGENHENEPDMRCFKCEDPHCSSNAEQNDLINKLISAFPILKDEVQEDILKKMRKVGLGGILEFTRAIHAEMDALTTAARKGISVRGASMFVTTFPCHYCARHLVAAGIDQVQYIEPYPKSRALSLHGDSITSRSAGWVRPSAPRDKDEAAVPEVAAKTVGDPKFGRDTNKHKVLFKPFVGVAPRLYHRAFTQDRVLKNSVTGKMEIGVPEWGGKWGIRAIPYTSLETRLTSEAWK